MEKDDYKGETYLAQGECTNCGKENYPQWGNYAIGKKLEEYPCSNCGCMTWRKRQGKFTDPDVGKTNESI